MARVAGIDVQMLNNRFNDLAVMADAAAEQRGGHQQQEDTIFAKIKQTLGNTLPANASAMLVSRELGRFLGETGAVATLLAKFRSGGELSGEALHQAIKTFTENSPELARQLPSLPENYSGNDLLRFNEESKGFLEGIAREQADKLMCIAITVNVLTLLYNVWQTSVFVGKIEEAQKTHAEFRRDDLPKLRDMVGEAQNCVDAIDIDGEVPIALQQIRVAEQAVKKVLRKIYDSEEEFQGAWLELSDEAQKALNGTIASVPTTITMASTIVSTMGVASRSMSALGWLVIVGQVTHAFYSIYAQKTAKEVMEDLVSDIRAIGKLKARCQEMSVEIARHKGYLEGLRAGRAQQ